MVEGGTQGPPTSRPGWGEGVPPHHPDLAGVPPTIQTWLGYPPHHQDLAGVPQPPPSRPGLGTPSPPSRPGWDTPPPHHPDLTGVPPPHPDLAGVPPPLVKVWTDKQTKNSTFPHPSDAGGNKDYYSMYRHVLLCRSFYLGKVCD